MINVVEYVFFRILGFFAGLLPYRANAALGSALGWVGFQILGIRKTVTLDNLRNAFPEKNPKERTRIAVGAYKSYGIAILQMLWTTRASDEELMNAVKVPEPSPLSRMVAAGTGFILLSGHFGGWEFLVHGLRLHAGKPFHSIVQRQRNSYVDRFVDRVRRRHDNQTIYKGMARDALLVLRSGGVLAALGDQSGPKESLFVNFFGRPAATHRGIAALSVKLNVPILFTVLVRQPDGRYLAEFEEVNRSGLPEDSEAAILELTGRHVAVLERFIRKYPDQWLWMHKRWKHSAVHAAPDDAERE
jgi:KDO2-lipid IV(A) lauroyltransferase